MMIRKVRERVEKFTRTLHIAAFDRRLEIAGARLIHYYDADVVLRMVMGFQLDNMVSDNEARLARALLSCHLLGKVYMLRPHAREWVRALARQPQLSGKAVLRTFADQARRYLRDRGIEATMARLREIALASEQLGEDGARKFIAALQENAGATFAAIEFVNGTWSNRLRRYYDTGLLCFDELGPEMKDLFTADSVVLSINTALRTQSQGARSIRADYSDSAALAILSQMVRSRDLRGDGPIVRFYTETNTLQQTWTNNSEVREFLSYKRPPFDDFAVPPGGDFIVRSSGHLLMRARFRELSPLSSENSIGDLHHLLDDLDKVLKMEEREFVDAISHMTWAGQNLLELIEELEELALMNSLWIQSGIPDGLVKSIPEWSEVFAFAQGESTSEMLFAQIEDIQEELGSKLLQIQSWSRNFEMLLEASKHARSERTTPIEEPMRDLGLVRWGYVLPEDEKYRLAEVAKALLGDSEEELLVDCAGLATRMDQAKEDVAQCAFMCAVLWALGRFDDIVSLIEDCERLGNELLPSLIVIRSAAKLKSGTVSRYSERKLLVDSVWELRESLPNVKKGEVLLGVGYVLYHAWKQESIGATLSHTDLPLEVSNWAERSFQAGEEAVAFFEPSGLPWAFAVNHCAYVGIVTGIAQDRVDSYFNVLIRLQNIARVWNSRFDDTLGCYYLRRLEEKASDEMYIGQAELAHMAAMASQFFSRAHQHDFGDIDIKEHILRLSIVMGKLKLR